MLCNMLHNHHNIHINQKSRLSFGSFYISLSLKITKSNRLQKQDNEDKQREFDEEITKLKLQIKNLKQQQTPTNVEKGDETDIKKLNRKLRMLEGENKELKEDVEEMRIIIENNVKTKRTFEEMQEEASSRREKLKQEREAKYGNKILSKELESAKEEWELERKKIDEEKEREVEKKIKNIEKKLQDETNKFKEISDENTKLIEKIENLKAIKIDNELQIDKLIAKIEKYRTEKELLQNQNKELELETKKLKDEKIESENNFKIKLDEMEILKKEDVEKMRKEIEESKPKEEVQKMEKEITDLKSELEVFHQKFGGYDQLNVPLPPPLNVPKKSVYPGKNGAFSMGDLLAQIKKGVKLRNAGTNEKDIDFPIEVNIANECANAVNSLRKTAWRKSLQRGPPLEFEMTAPEKKGPTVNSTDKKNNNNNIKK